MKRAVMCMVFMLNDALSDGAPVRDLLVEIEAETESLAREVVREARRESETGKRSARIEREAGAETEKGRETRTRREKETGAVTAGETRTEEETRRGTGRKRRETNPRLEIWGK